MSTFSERLKEAMIIRNMKQVELSSKTGIGKSAISQYLAGIFEPKQRNTYKIARALEVNEGWLMGHNVPMEREGIGSSQSSVYPIDPYKLPVLNGKTLKEPVVSMECWQEAGTVQKADFCIHMKGSSMENARLHDGDTVFVQKQATVKNGDIAAVLFEDEVYIRRFYKYSDTIVLMAENPDYPPMEFRKGKSGKLRLLGKALFFQSDLK